MNKYLMNTFWMLFEQVLRVASGLLVSIFVANIYGPELFGEYSFVLAVATLALASIKFGLDSVVIKELSSDNRESAEIFATSFWLMIFLGTLIYIATFTYFFLAGALDERVNIMILIVLLSGLISPFLVIDFLFQSKLKSKITCISKIIVMTVMTLVKLYLIVSNRDIYFLAICYVLDYVFLATLLIVNKNIREPLYLYSQFNLSVLKAVFKRAAPIAFSSLATIAMMRIDQLMIGQMLGMGEVGIYSAAVKFYEAWILIPYVISLSLLPYISKMRKESDDRVFYEKLSSIFSMLMYFSFFAFLFVYFFGDFFINLIFGTDYQASSSILKILMLSAVFSSVTNITARYMIVSELESKMLLRSVFLVITNVILNIVLIPNYGVEGAAYATLASILMSAYILDIFDSRMKKILSCKLRAFNVGKIIEFINESKFKKT